MIEDLRAKLGVTWSTVNRCKNTALTTRRWLRGGFSSFKRS
jgi:hypothetical protein